MQSMWAAGFETGHAAGFEDGYDLAMRIVAAAWYREQLAAGTVAA